VADADALPAALKTALERSAAYRRNEAANRFCQYHTVPNVKAHWVREIGEQFELPLGMLATRLDWQWVLDATNESPSAKSNAICP
jgi:hypothetical protein